MKGQKFLKVTSILMIIGGILALIVSILAIAGAAVLAAFADGQAGAVMGLIYVSAILCIVDAIIQLIAGAKGMKACKDPSKAGGCVTVGIVIVILCIVSLVLNIVGGGQFQAGNFVLSLVLPILYLLSAFMVKNGR